MIKIEETGPENRDWSLDDDPFNEAEMHELHLTELQELDAEGMHTRVVVVGAGAQIAGRTVRALLHQKPHVSILAIRRANQTIRCLADDSIIAVGDRLVLVARAEDFADIAGLFSAEADRVSSP